MPDRLVDKIKAAREAGVPLILVETPDQPAVLERIAAGFRGNGASTTPPPILTWNPVGGLTGANTPGIEALARIEPEPENDGHGPPPVRPSADLVAALSMVKALPERSMLIVTHALRAISMAELHAIAGVLALRDPFKATTRTLILLAPGRKLPPELAADSLILEDPKPDAAELGAMAAELAAARCDALGEGAALEGEAVLGAGLCMEGLNRFASEQAVALSLAEHGGVLDVEDLRKRRRDLIGQVPGLKAERGIGSREDVGGLWGLMDFAHLIMTGEMDPLAVIRIEELEKAIGGFGTESTGTTGDQVGVMLTAMEDYGWTGFLAAGVPGGGKSLVARILAGAYGREALTLDLGGAKDSLLGKSEQQIREVVATIRALAGARVLFVASVNRMGVIPPELRRRFRLGTWFFDLPTVEEKTAIWPIHLRAFGLPLDSARPDDTDWTGAEIRNACELARRFRTTPAAVAQYVMSVAKADPAYITQIRQSATGRWFSATTGRPYGATAPPVETARRFGR